MPRDYTPEIKVRVAVSRPIMGSSRANVCAAVLSAVVLFGQSLAIASAQVIPVGCQATLGYLSSTVSITGNPKLDALRQSMLSTDIREVMRKIAAQGLSITQALDLLDKQAQTDAAALPTLESNIRQAAQRPNDDLMAAIKNRNYGQVAIGEDVLSVAIQAYIADDWGQLTNRETARQIRCVQSGGVSNGGISPGGGQPLVSESIPKAVGLSANTSSQQSMSSPQRPSDSGPSLEITMQFIKEKLATPTGITFSEYISSGSGDFTLSDKQQRDIATDPAKCTLSVACHQTEIDSISDTILSTFTDFISLRDVESVEVKRFESTPTTYKLILSASQPVFTRSFTQTLKNGKPWKKYVNQAPKAFPELDYDFADEVLAKRVAAAMSHAVQLCGGGKKENEKKGNEPF
jgi:hypothetical protein